jgi:acyl-coenzyme A synthetase/AMP-(fatty) acid ligase
VYRTGDRARIRTTGELDFLGSTEHQILLPGTHVEPAEVEDALLKVTGVHDAAVVLHRIESREHVAAYVAAGDRQPEQRLLRAALRRTLPASVIPEQCFVLARLPHTLTGRADRAWLADHCECSSTGVTRRGHRPLRHGG